MAAGRGKGGLSAYRASGPYPILVKAPTLSRASSATCSAPSSTSVPACISAIIEVYSKHQSGLSRATNLLRNDDANVVMADVRVVALTSLAC